VKERRVLVVNPNSNATVTQGIDQAVAEFRQRDRLNIDCVDLPDAPFGIETDADIAAVVPRITGEVKAGLTRYHAFVIACYSDPALAECRALTGKPVLGIQQSAVALATGGGRRFGVLALGAESIERHVAYVRQLGMQALHAGERPLHLSVDAAANDPSTLNKIIDGGRQLIEQDDAEVLVLGCAGMARHRQAAEAALGVSVIDPVQAAVTIATQHFGV